MRLPLLTASLLMLAGQVCAAEFTDNSRQLVGPQKADKAVAAVTRHLGDPATAKFRGLYPGTNPAKRGVICGFVTARDKNGHMPPFQPFIYDPKTNDAVFMPRSDFKKKGVGQMNAGLYSGAGCGALIGM
jgi:hypothetical protein